LIFLLAKKSLFQVGCGQSRDRHYFSDLDLLSRKNERIIKIIQGFTAGMLSVFSTEKQNTFCFLFPGHLGFLFSDELPGVNGVS